MVIPRAQWIVRGVLALGLVWAWPAGDAAGQVQSYQRLRPLTGDLGVVAPGRSQPSLQYDLLEEAREVVLLVEDAAGQVVERRVAVGVRAGRQGFPWDGTTPEGQPLPAGAYRLRLRAVFQDGRAEEALVPARVADLPPPHPGVRPPAPAAKEPAQRVWGRVGGFWQKDNERETDTVSHEERATLGGAYRSPAAEVDALLDIRRREPGESDLDGSSGRAVRRWGSGDASAVFRRGLSTFDDPLALFSDFRTEYRKAGLQVRQAVGAARLSGLGFVAEGDTASEESGGAARMTVDLSADARLGASGTYRRLGAGTETRGADEAVGALDLHWRPGLDAVTALFAETALSRGFGDEWDGAVILGGRFRPDPRLQGELSLLHLGEDFSASLSNPLRDVQADAWGAASNGDLALPDAGPFAAPGFSWSAFWLRRHSRSQTRAEVDATLRTGIGEDTGLSLSWLGSWEEIGVSHSVLLNVDHRWNRRMSSRLQGAFTDSGFERTGRLRLEGEVREGPDGARLGLEGVARQGDWDEGRVTREMALLGDAWWGDWRTGGFARLNRRDGSEGVNLFLQLERTVEWLHRYRLRSYIALGDRAAFKTAEQVEIGVELSF